MQLFPLATYLAGALERGGSHVSTVTHCNGSTCAAKK